MSLNEDFIKQIKNNSSKWGNKEWGLKYLNMQMNQM
jgi:hypothetical protein